MNSLDRPTAYAHDPRSRRRRNRQPVSQPTLYYSRTGLFVCPIQIELLPKVSFTIPQRVKAWLTVFDSWCRPSASSSPLTLITPGVGYQILPTVQMQDFSWSSIRKQSDA